MPLAGGAAGGVDSILSKEETLSTVLFKNRFSPGRK
jgi:predicted dinucleotide-utilizing enzyme